MQPTPLLYKSKCLSITRHPWGFTVQIFSIFFQCLTGQDIQIIGQGSTTSSPLPSHWRS